MIMSEAVLKPSSIRPRSVLDLSSILWTLKKRATPPPARRSGGALRTRLSSGRRSRSPGQGYVPVDQSALWVDTES